MRDDEMLNRTQTDMVTTTSKLTTVLMGMAFLKVVNTDGENAKANTENVDPDEDG